MFVVGIDVLGGLVGGLCLGVVVCIFGFWIGVGYLCVYVCFVYWGLVGLGYW